MAIAFVQRSNAAGSSVTSIDVTLTGVVAGNLVVMGCLRTGATDRDLSTQDTTNAVNGTVAVAEAVHSAGNCEAAIDYIPAAVGGNTTYRLTANGSTSLNMTVYEFSGANASPFDAGDTAESSASTTAICADGGNIDTVADVAVVFCMVTSSGGSFALGTYPANYDCTGTVNRHGYRISAGALTDQDASQTGVIARNTVGAIASFRGVAASVAYNKPIIYSQAINRSNNY